MDIYGKSPIMAALSQIRLMNKSASLVYVNPAAYRDINKMKRTIKRKKSDIAWIRTLKCFPIPKIRFISPSLHMADIDFIEMSRGMERDIYKALQVPKEYLDSEIKHKTFLERQAALKYTQEILNKAFKKKDE